MNSQTDAFQILIIEDNTDFAYLLNLLLENLGHQCILAYDGIEGVNKAKEAEPDLIFCDIGLPKMDGFEVVKAFRKDEILKNVCIIALTGYADQYNTGLASEMGFDFLLPKPVAFEDLKQVIAKTGLSKS